MCYFLFLVEIIAFATSFFDRMFTADEIVVVVAFNDGNPVSGAGDSSSAGSRGSGANTNSNFFLLAKSTGVHSSQRDNSHNYAGLGNNFLSEGSISGPDSNNNNNSGCMRFHPASSGPYPEA